MRKKEGINSRLLQIIAFAGISFLLLFAAIIVLQKRQADMIHKESLGQFNREITSIINLKSTGLRQIAFDYTYWDEFATVMQTGATNEWFENNIATILSSFGCDYVSVYDKDYKLVYEHRFELQNLSKIVPPEVFPLLNEKKLLNFFIETRSGVMEVASASIHPTFDRERKATKPYGYLFIGRLWNSEYLGALSTLTNSSIHTGEFSKEAKSESSLKLKSFFSFTGWDEKEIGALWFVRENPIEALYNKSWIYMFFVLVFSMLIIWFSLRYSIKKWVVKPINLIELILKRESIGDIIKLKKSFGEFSQIGVLFERYIIQKEELREAKEREERADVLKTQFLSNISHEIRTPVNGIIGFSELLKDEAITKEQRDEYISIIQNGGERMILLINDLINMSKMESGQEEVVESTISLNSVFEHLFNFFKLDASKKGLYLKFANMGSDLLISTDREKLFIILNNLIKNAIKYSTKGTIEYGYKKEGEMLIFFVKDQGIGISDNLKDIVFDRFIQGESNKNKNYDGLGLGLPIAKAYTELLGGTIWFDSEVDKGTTFYFTLPYKL
ncbi:MAG: ATP-binding protein [Bacteroidales bacterium]|nr:ATP-binding protein [Bacteroidales bacterium]